MDTYIVVVKDEKAALGESYKNIKATSEQQAKDKYQAKRPSAEIIDAFLYDEEEANYLFSQALKEFAN